MIESRPARRSPIATAALTSVILRAVGLAGLGDILSDAEAAAAKTGYPVSCQTVRTPLLFTDPNTGHRFYDQKICTRPGDPAGYSPQMIIDHPEIYKYDVEHYAKQVPAGSPDILAWARPKSTPRESPTGDRRATAPETEQTPARETKRPQTPPPAPDSTAQTDHRQVVTTPGVITFPPPSYLWMIGAGLAAVGILAAVGGGR